MGYLCGLHRGMDTPLHTATLSNGLLYSIYYYSTVFTRSILESRPPHRWVPSGYYKVLKNIFIFFSWKII